MDRTSSRWPVVVAGGAIFLAAGLIGLWSVELGYYAFSPGPVGDAVSAVIVAEVETYQPTEELLMLTVSNQTVNPIEAIIAGLDPTIDLVRREAVRSPDETDEEFVARNRASMDLSKETAITLALERLGYEVTTSSDGVVIAEIVGDAPAAEVLQVNDVITAVNGRSVSLPDEIGDQLGDQEPGDSISLDIEREGSPLTVSVRLIGRDEDPTLPMIGISVVPRNPHFDYPFPIDIDAGLIGGPSAGMMYTLAVLELLSPGDLTQGRVVAGTGTINAAGEVGSIGGIRQKVVAAEAAGADVMLVPASNYEEALSAPRDTLELIPVATLDEVLEALAAL